MILSFVFFLLDFISKTIISKLLNVNESIKCTIKHKAELLTMDTALLIERLSKFGITVDANISKAIEIENQALEINYLNRNNEEIAESLGHLGKYYYEIDQYEKAIKYDNKI